MKKPNKLFRVIIAVMIALLVIPQMAFAKAPAIIKINNLSATVQKGAKYALPKVVKATMTGNKTQNVAVTWNVKSVSTVKEGTYNFTGTVKNYSKKVVLTLKVISSSKTTPSTSQNDGKSTSKDDKNTSTDNKGDNPPTDTTSGATEQSGN